MREQDLELAEKLLYEYKKGDLSHSEVREQLMEDCFFDERQAMFAIAETDAAPIFDLEQRIDEDRFEDTLRLVDCDRVEDFQ